MVPCGALVPLGLGGGGGLSGNAVALLLLPPAAGAGSSAAAAAPAAAAAAAGGARSASRLPPKPLPALLSPPPARPQIRELRQVAEDELAGCGADLDAEAREDDELRAHYGGRWRRPPSVQLTKVCGVGRGGEVPWEASVSAL